MSESESQFDQIIDRLLAEHRSRAEQRVDASALLQRVRRTRQESAMMAAVPESLAQPTTARRFFRHSTATVCNPSRPLLPRWLTGASLAAAVLLAALLAVRYSSPKANRVSLVLRDLRSVHLRQLDRCYRVQYAPDPRYWDPTNRLEGPSHSLLWTRGDRFWSECTIGNQQFRIGRQRDGVFWLRLTPHHGVTLCSTPAELPQEVRLLCAANSLTVPRLVEEVLADFELHATTPAEPSEQPGLVVWASLKPGHVHPVVSAALLEINPADHSLIRLVLWMVRDGQPRGTVTYTLLESARLDEAQYELSSHLEGDAQIETPPEQL